MTDSSCDSTYTIDRRTGEKLSCDLDWHVEGFRGAIHQATWRDVRWVWNDTEADK